MTTTLVHCGLDETGTVCSGHSQPGTVNLRQAMRERWGHTSDGIYNCRPVRGGTKLSEHGEGRAYDDHCTDEAEGRAECDVLVAAACELGIEEVIFWDRIWTTAKGWHDYHPGPGGDNHHTHVHVGQNWSGAKYLTLDAARAALATPTPAPLLEDDDMRPRCMHFNGAIFAVGYSPDEFQWYGDDDKPKTNPDGSPVMVRGPWRMTFPNMDRLEQVVQGGGVQVDEHGNAFEATNADFAKVFLNRGAA